PLETAPSGPGGSSVTRSALLATMRAYVVGPLITASRGAHASCGPRAILFLATQPPRAGMRPCGPSKSAWSAAGGKSKKAALAAVARKLLIAINAMMRDQRPWQPAV